MVAVEPEAVLWQRDSGAFIETRRGRAAIDDLVSSLERCLATSPAGARAIGFFGYEYAAALDAALPRPGSARTLPDAWWALLPPRPSCRPVAAPPWRARRRGGDLAVSLDDEQFRRGVERIRAAISAGDYFQVDLTRRWSVSSTASPLSLFAHLRGAVPPRFATFLADVAQGWAVCCLSPELLLRRAGETVETRPIKGTRPRDRRPPAAVGRELRASAKDAAELAMIVDLERNDLNRVCTPGSVRVVSRAATLATRDVVHLEARIQGRLELGVDLRELLGALLPGGSVTGAPKIAACHAIAALEPVARSVYCGALGVIRAGGDLTLALPIRTGYAADGVIHFHSGCGIVADSDAAAEVRESRAKVRSWLRALEAL